jgi:hypothetical protein
MIRGVLLGLGILTAQNGCSGSASRAIARRYDGGNVPVEPKVLGVIQ